MMEWKRRFSTPARLTLHVLHTGEVKTKGNIHFNPRSPKFKGLPKEERYNPVFAYLVRHPDKGPLLLDTGLHHSFAESRFGNFGPLLGSLVRGRSAPGKDVRSQLRGAGIAPQDVRHILLSHLHLDHPSGLPYFAGIPGVKVYVDAAELAEARAPLGFLKGYVKRHLDGIEFQGIPYGPAVPPFRGVCDLFGDGSVFAVRTAGHTAGHASVVLNAMDGPILLTFDAVHRKANVDEGVPPSGDYEGALASVQDIESFLREFPETRVIYGHDPDQLGSLVLPPGHYT